MNLELSEEYALDAGEVRIKFEEEGRRTFLATAMNMLNGFGRRIRSLFWVSVRST